MENTDFNDIQKFIRALKILDYSETDIEIILKKKEIDIENIKSIIKYFNII